MIAEKVLLKKYANRRLYDTEESTYVTLNQVADMIKKGQEVEVIDAKTEEDVTAFVLTQIVLEEARNKNVLLPASLLHLFIQYGETILEEFFEKYLQLTIENYLVYKSEVDKEFGKWLELPGMDIPEMVQKAMTGLSPFQSFFRQFSESADNQKKKEPSR